MLQKSWILFLSLPNTLEGHHCMYIECTQTKNCKFSKNVSLTNILSHQVERRQSMATGLGLFTCSNVGWDQ